MIIIGKNRNKNEGSKIFLNYLCQMETHQPNINGFTPFSTNKPMTNEATKFLLYVEAAFILPALLGNEAQIRVVCSCLVIVSTFMIIVINLPKFTSQVSKYFGAAKSNLKSIFKNGNKSKKN